jgi:FlaG/FlaF family flagellin (archaellin)
MFKLTKKGVSEVIVTTMIIVVTVILVTMFLAWMRESSKNKLDQTADEMKQASDLSCLNASFKVESCTIDSSTKETNILFTNNSNLKIYNLILTIEGKNDSEEDIRVSGRFDEVVDAGESINFTTDSNFTGISGNLGDINISTITNMTLTNGTCPKKIFVLDCEIE